MREIETTKNTLTIEFTRDEVIQLRHMLGCLPDPVVAENLNKQYPNLSISHKEINITGYELFEIFAGTMDEWEKGVSETFSSI